MTVTENTFLLLPEAEAKRLWRGALDARANAADSLVSLSECLMLGVRSAEVLAIHRLQDVAHRFPATIQARLEVPQRPVQIRVDAVETPQTLGFREILDVLSDDSLECIARDMHHGWEDRRFSCGRARDVARDQIGITLSQEGRDDLLLLLAYCNRIFRYPPPLEIKVSEVLDSFPSLEEMVRELGVEG